MANTGEKPGKGTYECTKCYAEITLDDKDALPKCPRCNATTFAKVCSK